MKEKEVVFAHLYLSYDCNLNCSYCSLPSLKKELMHERDLTLDEWKEGITALRERVLSFNLYGLEPTLYPQIVELCAWMSEEKIPYVLNTNGLVPDVMNRLTKIPLAGIAMSCDSLDGNYPDFGSQLKSTAFLNWRKRFDHVPVKIVGVTVTRKNLTKVVFMVKKFSSWGWLTCVNLLMEQSSEDQVAAAKKGIKDISFRPEDKWLVGELGRVLAENVEKFNLIYDSSYFERWGDYIEGKNLHYCDFNRTDVISVSPDGFLWPCQEIPGDMARKHSFHIRNVSDDLIWNNYKEARKKELIQKCKGTSNGCCYLAREVGAGRISPEEVV